MQLLRRLRWKLFLSHVLIIVVAIGVFLPTVYLLSGGALPQAEVLDRIELPIDAERRGRIDEVFDEALLIAAFASLAAAVIVSLFVSRRVVEPIQDLTLVSGRLARGYFRERTMIRSDDELALLSHSINQLAENLEQTEQRRLGLIADVAHELRTPLATIAGYMEGLLDDIIKPEPKLYALVHHEATRLRWMIEEMALLSRAEAGQLRVAPRPIEVQLVVGQVIDQFRPQVQAQGMSWDVQIADSLPKIHADPDRIRQVLINLIANAVQYSPMGGTIGVHVRGDERAVTTIVSDTGIGIAAEHVPHIFERFYRVDKSRARTTGGAGIGLTIARHLIYAHGGEIWAESDGLGRGTRITFTLPTVVTS